MERILVGTDFSVASARAVQVAAAWARRTAAALRVVHVVPPKRSLIGLWAVDLTTVSAVHHRAGAALKRLAEGLDPARQIEISTGLVAGAASMQIARAARDFRADLLVMGARGEQEVGLRELTLGGTAIKLLSTTSVPLLLVRTAAAEAPAWVLAAVDFSPVSKSVLTWARRCIVANGRIDVFHAYEAPFAARLDAYGISRESIDLYSDEEQKQRERELDSLIAATGGDVTVRPIVERGVSFARLIERIRQLDPDLVVVGKHASRRRPADWAGSVSRHTAFFSPSSVLIVPPSPASS
jgi:nucleotide-binding universal stress UspA family protein